MCSCEATFVCTKCTGTPHDWRYWHDEPKTVEEEAYEGRYDLSVTEIKDRR